MGISQEDKDKYRKTYKERYDLLRSMHVHPKSASNAACIEAIISINGFEADGVTVKDEVAWGVEL